MPINRGTDKENVEYIYSGMLAIKRNKLETVVVRWMNLGASLIVHLVKNPPAMQETLA